MSVVSGATTQPATCTSSTGAPSICIDNNADVSTGNDEGHFGIVWNGNSPANDTYQPTNTNSTNGSFAFYLEDTDQNPNNGKIMIVQKKVAIKLRLIKLLQRLQLMAMEKV